MSSVRPEATLRGGEFYPWLLKDETSMGIMRAISGGHKQKPNLLLGLGAGHPINSPTILYSRCYNGSGWTTCIEVCVYDAKLAGHTCTQHHNQNGVVILD